MVRNVNKTVTPTAVANLPKAVRAIRGAFHVVLAGDHLQLGPMEMVPTLLANLETHDSLREVLPVVYEFGGQSLFERIIKRGDCQSVMLRTQYRAHPALSQIHSTVFYSGLVVDGLSLSSFEKKYDTGEKRAMVWVDTSAMPRRQEGRDNQICSFYNRLEAHLVMDMLETNFHPGEKTWRNATVCIITSHSAQARMLKEWLVRFSHLVEVSTIDSMQGKERDIIILSCIRSNGSKGSFGFLKDQRRINVCLSRARNSLFIVGDAGFLLQEETWRMYSGYCSYASLTHCSTVTRNCFWPMTQAIQPMNQGVRSGYERHVGPGGLKRGSPPRVREISAARTTRLSSSRHTAQDTFNVIDEENDHSQVRQDNQVYCNLCKVSISGRIQGPNFNSHLRGKVHSNNVSQKAIEA